jgi:NADH-quinone oxidoreductase subunit B
LGLFEWARAQSLLALPFVGTICCRRMARWLDPGFAAGVGDPPGTWTPQHADLLVLVGRISQKQAPALLRIADRMPQPARILHVAGCHRGQVEEACYASVLDPVQILPLTVTVQGCPATESVLQDALKKMRTELAGGITP